MLTAHVTASVGWLGAVLLFLTLCLVALWSADTQLVRAVHLVSDPAARLVILPLALASLLTGVTQALTTQWGLLRHYWIVFKLVMTVVATVMLLQYLPTIRYLSSVAAEAANQPVAEGTHSLVLHSAGGLLVLLAATVLSVYKPRGRTPIG